MDMNYVPEKRFTVVTMQARRGPRMDIDDDDDDDVSESETTAEISSNNMDSDLPTGLAALPVFELRRSNRNSKSKGSLNLAKSNSCKRKLPQKRDLNIASVSIDLSIKRLNDI